MKMLKTGTCLGYACLVMLLVPHTSHGQGMFYAEVRSLILRAEQEGLALDSAIYLLDSALQMSRQVKYADGTARSLYKLGDLCLKKGDGASARAFFAQAIDTYSKLEDSVGLMLSHKQLGSVERFLGDLGASLDQYRIGLEIARLTGNREQEIRIGNNIGTIYFEQGHLTEAEQYYSQCLSLEPNDPIRAVLLGNLAMVASKREDYDQALAYYDQSLAIQKQIGDEEGWYNTKGLKASLYLNTGELEQALELEKESLSYLIGQQNWPLILVSHNKLGLIYNELEWYDSARMSYQRSLAIANEIDSDDLVFIIANLAFNEADAGHYAVAYDYLFRHLEMKDSLFTLEKNYQLEELLAKYESEKKGKEISILQTEKVLNDAEIEKGILIRNVAIGGSAMLMVLVVLVIYSYSQKLNNKEVVAQKNEEINRRTIQEILKENEIKNVKASLEGQENERRRIARELHDGVAGTLAGIKLKLSRINTGDLDELLQELDMTYHEVRTLSHHLSSSQVLNTPFISLLSDFVKNCSDSADLLELHFIGPKNQTLNNLPDQYKIDLYRIVQELVINVQKHAEASYAELVLTVNDCEINLMVEDNGKGFDPEKKRQGIGLDNIKQRIKGLSGEIHIDSQIGRGSIVSIDLPIPKMEEETIIESGEV